ncbi:MAG: hypothetical protein AAGH15_18110, partial [Myxococcota bacterium]
MARSSRLVVHDAFPSLAFVQANLRAREVWPTVVIRTRAAAEYRPDIAGPLSLFVNRRGASHATIDGRRLRLPAGCAALSAAGERFTLDYEAPVELLNVYFADDWVADVAGSLDAEARALLEPLERG